MPGPLSFPSGMNFGNTLGGIGGNLASAGMYGASAAGSISEVNAAGEANRAITRAITQNKLQKEGTDGAKEVA